MYGVIVLGIVGVVVIVLFFLLFRERTKYPEVKPMFSPEKAPRREERKEAAPVSGKCDFCGVTTSMPFKCKYCGKLYCDAHRLPESHECIGLPVRE